MSYTTKAQENLLEASLRFSCVIWCEMSAGDANKHLGARFDLQFFTSLDCQRSGSPRSTAPARTALDQASALVRDLRSARLQTLTLNTQGDSFFYAGDYRAARPLFEQALQAASKAQSPDLELLARINIAKVDVKDGRARAAIPKLRDWAARADELRVRPLVAETRMYLGEALLLTGDTAGARRELESALALSDKQGLRSISANLHFLLASAFERLGQAAVGAKHLADARQIVEALRQESRTDDLLARDDLRRIVATTKRTS